MQAKLSGESRGNDFSLLVLAVVSLIGAVGCFGLSIWVPWALLGSAVFLLGFAFILYVWRLGAAARVQTEAPPAQFSWKSGQDELALSIPVDPRNYVAKKMLAGMRGLVQQRGLPPVPHGAVEGNAADQASLREYSSEERQAIEKKWAEEIPKHDLLVVEQLESTLRSLESASSETETTVVEVTGVRQLPVQATTEAVTTANAAGIEQLPAQPDPSAK